MGKPQIVQERLTDVKKRIDSQSVVARSEPGNREAPKPPCRASLKDTGGDCKASPRTGAPVRSWPVKKSGMDKQVTVQKRSEVARETLKNSLVCLTQQQLEQILSSITQATDAGSQSPGCSSQPQSGELTEPPAQFGPWQAALLYGIVSLYRSICSNEYQYTIDLHFSIRRSKGWSQRGCERNRKKWHMLRTYIYSYRQECYDIGKCKRWQVILMFLS